MSQKVHATGMRLNNRNSWTTILNVDNRQFSNLFFVDLQTRFFLSTVLNFFSILNNRPLTKFYKSNSIYVQSGFTTKILRKTIISSSQRTNSFKKLVDNYQNFTHFNNSSRFHIYDFNQWSKNKLFFILRDKIEKSSFNLIKNSSAQMLGLYIGQQLESSFKQRDLNFRSNLKKGVGKTLQSFLSIQSRDSICGIKVICSGRWKKTKSGRKQTFTFSKGKLSTQSFSSFVDIGFYTGQTKYGKFSLKVYITYTNK